MRIRSNMVFLRGFTVISTSKYGASYPHISASHTDLILISITDILIQKNKHTAVSKSPLIPMESSRSFSPNSCSTLALMSLSF